MGSHYVTFAGVVLCLMKGLRFADQTSFLTHRRSRVKAAYISVGTWFCKGGGSEGKDPKLISIKPKAYS